MPSLRSMLVLSLLTATACAPPAPPPPVGEADLGDRNADLARSGYEAFARGDMAAVVALMDSAIVWHEAESLPYGGVYHGPEAVLENVFMAIGRDWEPFAAVPREYIQADRDVVVLGEYSGTHRGTGKAFVAPFVHLWRFEDGLLVEFRQFTDTALWLAAM
jgi:uncharacterized protein